MSTVNARAISGGHKLHYDRCPCDSIAGPNGDEMHVQVKVDEMIGRAFDALQDNWLIHSKQLHGSGMLQSSMQPDAACGLKSADLIQFCLDTNHGLFHGIMTFIWACYHQPIKLGTVQAGCLLHDFLRVKTGHILDHDVALRDVFPYLDHSAYSHHCNPDAKYPLVQGDRMELHAVRDHKDWLEMELLPFGYDRKMAEFFYRYTRPALEKLFRHRDSVWLRHAPEATATIEKTISQCGGSRVENRKGYFPWQYWVAPDHVGFSVEADMSRDSFSRFNLEPDRIGIYGYVPLDRGHGRLQNLVDHEAVSALIPDSDWVFTITEPYQLYYVPDDCCGMISQYTASQFLEIVSTLEVLLVSYFNG